GIGKRLLPQSSQQKKPEWLHLGSRPITVDDDDHTLEKANKLNTRTTYLCVGCGTLMDSPSGACATKCTNRSLREARLIKTQGDRAARCLSCGALGAHTLRRFESGNDACCCRGHSSVPGPARRHQRPDRRP